MYRSYFQFLETEDECFEYYMYPQHGFWQISGLALPDEVLWKLYVVNPAKVIPGITVPNGNRESLTTADNHQLKP